MLFNLLFLEYSRNMSHNITILPVYDHMCLSFYPPFNRQTEWPIFTKTWFKHTVRRNNANLKVVEFLIST